MAVSQNNGLTYVFITNSSPWVGARFPYEVNRMMARALRRVDDWPEINLFDPYSIEEDNFVESKSYDTIPKTEWEMCWDFANLG